MDKELQYLYHSKFTQEELYAATHSLEQQRNLTVKKYSNATIVPANQSSVCGVYDAKGNYIDQSGFVPAGSVTKLLHGDTRIGEEYKPHKLQESSIEYYPFEVIYLYVKYHYGHFLVDTLSRAWPKEIYESNIPIAVVIDEQKIAPYMKQALELLGIDSKRIIVVNKPSSFSCVYIPDFSYSYMEYFTNEYRQVFDRMIDGVELSRPVYEKIYFSRVHFAKHGINRAEKGIHREYGEAKIEKIFEKNGFKILYPEELSFIEQIYYIKHCNIFATTNGTIAHNIVFAKEHTKLILLHRYPTTYFGNWHQKAINEIRHIECVSIDAYQKGSFRGLSLMIYSKELHQFLKAEGYRDKIPMGVLLQDLAERIEYFSRVFVRNTKSLLRK